MRKPLPISLGIARLWILLLLSLVLPAFALTACGNDGRGGSPVVASGAELLQGGSAQDWVTFADHLVTVRLVSSRESTPEFEEPGKFTVGRVVTLAVGDVLWSRKDAPPLPDTLDWQAGGWAVKDGERSEFNIGGSPRIAAGHEFLIPVFYYARIGWAPLTNANVYSYDDQQIGNGPDRVGWAESTWIDEYEGMNAEVVAEVLRETPPAPGTEDFMKVNVVKRLSAMQEFERQGSTP